MESSTTKAPMGAGFGRWLARLLAVLAVVAAAIALYVVISNSLDSTGEDDKPKRAQHQQAQEQPDVPETYVVQTGDSLGSIAVKFGIPVERLEELNPDVDPQALQTGGTLRLKP